MMSLHHTAAIARQWHESQRLACKAVIDDDAGTVIDLDTIEPHEDMAATALDVASEKYGDEAIGLVVYTVSPDERTAVRWTIRWYDERRDPCGRKIPWIEEGKRVAWDAAKAVPR